MSERAILHLDLDTFFVSVERLENSELANRPVLVGGTSARGVVASCSYEARKFGIHSAMPMKMALRLCPEAVVIKGDSSRYSYYSNMVTDIVKETMPMYEKSSIDEFYIDMSGMDKFYGCNKMSKELRERIIKETGLPISFGLSLNKTVSKVATGQAKPNNMIEVSRGLEKPFLAPLPVGKIPMIGDKTSHLLKQMGVYYIKTLQEMPVVLMEKAFGLNGVGIWKKANGIDETPVVPTQERKSISLERTFEQDTIDVHKLKRLLTAMIDTLAYQLRMGNKLTSCITVKLRYADFNTYTMQKRIPYTSCDHTLLTYAREIFDKLYNRNVRIRLLGVRCSGLVGGGHQINLFEDSVDVLNLYAAMDKIRDKYGTDAIKRAGAMHVKNLARGNPFNGEPPIIPAHRRS